MSDATQEAKGIVLATYPDAVCQRDRVTLTYYIWTGEQRLNPRWVDEGHPRTKKFIPFTGMELNTTTGAATPHRAWKDAAELMQLSGYLRRKAKRSIDREFGGKGVENGGLRERKHSSRWMTTT